MKLRTLKKTNKVLTKSIRLWTHQRKCNNKKLIKSFIKFDNTLR